MVEQVITPTPGAVAPVIPAVDPAKAVIPNGEVKPVLISKTQEELDAMFSERAKRAAAAKEKELADELGMSIADLKKLAKNKKEADEAAKTKEQKLADERDSAKKELAQVKLGIAKRAIIEKLIVDKKIALPPGLTVSETVDYVNGEDEESMRVSADRLIKLMPFTAPGVGNPSNPANPGQGKSLKEQIVIEEANARKTGDYRKVTALKLKLQTEVFKQ